MRILHLGCFMLLFAFAAKAQETASISGKVTDENNQPVFGANVLLLGTGRGTSTNADGEFTMSDISASNYFIQVSYLGYQSVTREIELNADTTLDFALTKTSDQLNEVVVTAANRRLQNVQRTAASVSVANAQEVADLQIGNINELGRITSNFRTYDDGGGSFPLVSTRGITTIDATPVVGVYVDDVPLFNISSFPSYFGDIERIEILKGPQGTLYGRNSIGGVINIISKNPTNYTKGYVTTGYGNLNQYDIQAGISTPLIKNKLFAKINGGLTARDGYIENTFLNNTDLLGREAYNGNLKLTYVANDNWLFKLNSGYERREVNAYAFVGGFGATGTVIENTVNNSPFQVSQNTNGLYVTDIFNNAFNLKFTNDYIRIEAITAYQYTDLNRSDDDFDFSPADIQAVASDITRLSTISQEIRLSSNTKSKLDWIGGLYLYSVSNESDRRTRNGADNIVFNPFLTPEEVADAQAQFPYDQLSDNEVRQKGLSLFGQASYQLTDKLTATAGLRYEIEDSSLEVDNRFEQDGQDFVYPNLNAVPMEFDKETEFSAFSPKFSLGYQANENSFIFANVTRGYRPGGVNSFVLDENRATFDPEFSWNYELGTKNTLWNNKVKLNATLFYINYTDQQLFNVIDLATFSIGTENIGNSKSYGVELETEFIVTKGLSLMGNLGYLKTEFTDYEYTFVQTLSEAPFFQEVAVDNKGNQQVMSPEWSGSIGANYTANLNKKWKGSIVVDYQFQSEVFFDPENTASQDAYGLLNGRLVAGSKNLEFALWAKNLTDVTYLSYGYSVSSSGIFASYGLPQTYGATVTTKF
ncbi:TonB-dependent receptor [Muricauda sp. SCSIO 64092]|uniref:TonB-dependent receptor n=1 Tax=Allomuricauda sp. SCSIO 64092 TaxID=2908842 RepID=UPI001FF62F2A|nr:TonB-dependent receptor [Muricauda sp. SCSIO 64092]UOY06805.1 TonB-dependent receptor [Muricauda sp. SCSIO 64092]